MYDKVIWAPFDVTDPVPSFSNVKTPHLLISWMIPTPLIGVRLGLNPNGASIHVDPLVAAYCPRMALGKGDLADAMVAVINIVIAATITNTANFFILPFIWTSFQFLIEPASIYVGSPF